MGDSTALVLGIAWDASLDAGTEVLGQATLGCGIADGVPMSKTAVIPTAKSCASWPDEWAAAVGRADPRVAIVMAGAWEVLDHRVNGQNVRFGTPRWDEVVQAAFDKAVTIAGAGGSPVALLTVPCFKQDLATATWARDRNDPARVARANQLLRAAAAHHPNVTVIEYGGFVCPTGAYENDVQGVSMRFDGVHLSAAGARATWQWLLPQLKALDPDYAP